MEYFSSSVSAVPLSHLCIAFLEGYHPKLLCGQGIRAKGETWCGLLWDSMNHSQLTEEGTSLVVKCSSPRCWAALSGTAGHTAWFIPWPWLPEATPSQVSDLQHLSLHLTDRILAFFVAGLALSWQTDLVLYPEALFIYKFRNNLNFLPPGSYKSRPLWHANCGSLEKIQNG